MRYLDEHKRWSAEYYRHIYGKLVQEIEEQASSGFPETVRKWKKDLLLMLLEEASRPTTARKVLRKKVVKDIETAGQRGYEQYEKSETKANYQKER